MTREAFCYDSQIYVIIKDGYRIVQMEHYTALGLAVMKQDEEFTKIATVYHNSRVADYMIQVQ